MDDIKPVQPVNTPMPRPEEEVLVERQQPSAMENPDKGYVQTVVLSSMFGYWGVDRFYLGKIGTGILKLLTLGGFGLWYLVDLIIAIVGAARQKHEDAPLHDTPKYKPFFVKLVVVCVIIYLVLIAVQILFVAVAVPKIVHTVKQHNICMEVNGVKDCKTLDQLLQKSSAGGSSDSPMPDLHLN